LEKYGSIPRELVVVALPLGRELTCALVATSRNRR
jgi:hypothetical protein